ncbi:MAG: tetratricopeptide repeat protein [Candidatus Sericytochromatia bacterium]|nr:tetratricopeptide repeat protein [Candidatus Sericytochromatia bacterium]
MNLGDLGDDWRALRGVDSLRQSEVPVVEGASWPDPVTIEDAWQLLREGYLERALAFWVDGTDVDYASTGLGLACALTLQESGRPEEADALYGRVLGRDGTSARGWYLRGLLALERGRAGDAAEALEKAVACEPGASLAWSALGQARWEAGDRQGAREALSEALALEPADGPARQQLALLLLEEGHLAEARAELAFILREDPTDVQAWLHLGQVEAAAGDWPAVMKAHERAAEIQPDWPEPWVRLATLAWNAGQLEASEASLRLATALDPHHMEAHRLLALIAHRRGDAVESLRHADLMLMEAPEAPDGFLFRAGALARQGREQEAELALGRWLAVAVGED